MFIRQFDMDGLIEVVVEMFQEGVLLNLRGSI
jgi:hypothetical protein